MAEIVDFGLQKHKIKMDSRYFDNGLSVVAGDTGRRIEVQLLDTNGMVQNTTGLNLRLNAVVGGKATYTDATLVDAATGKYQLDLSNGMFLAPGNWQFQWQITDSAGKKLHSFAFTGNVGKNISEGGSQSTNFYLNLDDLKAMQEDLVNGTFDSEVLETNIAEKLTNLETEYAPKLTEVTAQLAQKVGGGKLATMGDMGQDIKTAMTGGAVAVVGPNAVAEVNVIDNQITPRKASFFKQNQSNLINPDDFTKGYVSGTGAIVPEGVSRVSQTLLNINPNSYYRLQSEFPLGNTTIYVATYLNGVFRTRHLFTNTQNAVFQTGPNDNQCRISCIGDDEYKLFLHEGTDELDFEPPLVIDDAYLAKKEQIEYRDQTDFVDLLLKHNRSSNTLKAKIMSDRNIRVYIPISQGKYVGYYFEKNPKDDFIVFASVVMGSFTGEVFNQEQYLVAGSNKEFAIRVRPSGTTGNYHWFPEHESVGSAYSINQSILFDGVQQIGNSDISLKTVNIVSIIQKMNLIYPGDAEPSGLLELITTISNEGVTYSGGITWLRDMEIERGYVAMFPTIVPPMDTLRTSMGNDYDITLTTGSSNLKEEDKASSYAFLNKNGLNPNASYVIAQTIINPERTFRKGGMGRKEMGVLWIEHRNNGQLQKLYPQIYQNHKVALGDKISFGATTYSGIMPMANTLLK